MSTFLSFILNSRADPNDNYLKSAKDYLFPSEESAHKYYQNSRKAVGSINPWTPSQRRSFVNSVATGLKFYTAPTNYRARALIDSARFGYNFLDSGSDYPSYANNSYKIPDNYQETSRAYNQFRSFTAPRKTSRKTYRKRYRKRRRYTY